MPWPTLSSFVARVPAVKKMSAVRQEKIKRIAEALIRQGKDDGIAIAIAIKQTRRKKSGK